MYEILNPWQDLGVWDSPRSLVEMWGPIHEALIEVSSGLVGACSSLAMTNLVDCLLFRSVQFARRINCIFFQKVANLVATVKEVIVTDVLFIGMFFVISGAKFSLSDRSSSVLASPRMWASHKRMSIETELRQELLRTT